MRSQSKSVFTRLTLTVVGTAALLSLAGTLVGQDASAGQCLRRFCTFQSPYVWLKLAHVGLAGLTGLLLLGLVMLAWRSFRTDAVVLPLTTVTAVLFLGQAFVGAILVERRFRLDLLVLHSASAVSFWISLITLAAISMLRPSVEGHVPPALSPRRWRDFLELNKPWIVGLLLVTTFGGMVAGGRALPPADLAAWTLIGGALAAGGSSALNQYIDRDLDKQMQRTARRPLPAGRLTPAEGLSYGLLLCVASYYLLACLVNFTAAALSLAGILYYVVVYSILLKRATVQNIVLGGGAGAVPPMVGWAAAAGHLGIAAWILFLIIFMWTPPHFWALAIVRIQDYRKASVPMLPVVKGEQDARRQIMVYTILLVAATLLLPLVGAAGILYSIAAVLLGAVVIVAAWRVWRIPGNKVAWGMYRLSSMYLLLIFAAIVADSLL